MTAAERTALASEMALDGFCSGFGFTCGQDTKANPSACRRCIRLWLLQTGISRLDDARLGKYAKQTYAK